jgi:hypothetical protein
MLVGKMSGIIPHAAKDLKTAGKVPHFARDDSFVVVAACVTGDYSTFPPSSIFVHRFCISSGLMTSLVADRNQR